MVRGVAVARRHEAPVDIERCRGTGVPEPVGDGAKVDASGQKLGRYEVAQIVKPDVAKTDLLAEPGPAPGDHVGSPRLLTERVGGKDQFRFIEIPSGG